MNFMRARKHIKLLVSVCAFENRIKESMKLESKLQDAAVREEALKAEVELLNNVLKESPDVDKNEKIKRLERTVRELKQDNEYYTSLIPAITKKRS
jgi:hypothetical protein